MVIHNMLGMPPQDSKSHRGTKVRIDLTASSVGRSRLLAKAYPTLIRLLVIRLLTKQYFRLGLGE
jgi:hypothetical protein